MTGGQATSRHAIAGPQRQIDPEQWSSVHTEPCHPIVASTGAAAASASQAHGHALRAALAPDDSGGQDADREQRGEIGRRLDHEGVQAAACAPTIPTVATRSATVATMTTAPRRRTISSSRGNATYSWASTAIDQNDRLGLDAWTTFCTSRPLTRTDFASGFPCPG